MKSIYFLIYVFFAFSFTTNAQSVASKEELFDDGEYFFWRGDYQEAVYYYLQLIKKEPENSNFNFKAGECYLNILGQETKAIPYFEKAVEKNTVEKQDYKRKSIDEKNAPLHAYFYLGNAYRINNELDKALRCYDIFINDPNYEGNYNLTVVENEIKACERAKIIKDSPISLKIVNMDKPVNNAQKNSNPVVSGDESVLVFVTSLAFYDAVFFSTKDEENNWTKPVNINPQILSDGDLYPTGISYDGTQLIFVKKGKFQDDLYESTFNGEEWTEAKPLGKNINTRNNENYGALSPDGKKLYFSSDKPGSEGGFDLYVSFKESDGWGKAKNLGESINTEFDEVAPHIVNKSRTIFFSSKGHYGMGGYDIFYSNKEENSNKWGEPINIGFPVNTTGDNVSFYPVQDGKVAYSALEQQDGHGNLDIYRIEIKSSLTHVYRKNKENNQLQPKGKKLSDDFTLYIVNEFTKDTIAVLKYDKRGTMFEFLDFNDDYSLQIK